jgi:hypothetical protein
MPVLSSKPYRVGRSRTGLGLFATQPIKKGSKIIRYFGPMLDCKKTKDDAVENKYLFQITKRWTVDGSVRKNVARYINHACKPNAESDVNTRKLKITIRAIKNIEPGQEINYDYGTEYYKEYLKPIGCKCDSCERKRKKKRADERAEKLALKGKAEKKALQPDSKKKLSGKVKARPTAKPSAKTKVKTKAKSKAAPKPVKKFAGKTTAAKKSFAAAKSIVKAKAAKSRAA